MKLVSIITPSYNQAAYLEQTLRSVLEQDYPQLEYFVADGGSTDGSLEIIQRYAPRLAWWVSEKDSGQADAVNKGFARASGEIIGWLNSDDLYEPGCIARAAGLFEQHPEAALVCGDVRSIDGDGQAINIMRFDDWSLPDLLAFNIISQPGVFIRRSALEKTGYLDLSYHYLLDHQLWLRVLQHGSLIYTPVIQASARFHAEAKNVAHAAEFGREAFRIVDWMQTQPALQPLFAQHRRRILAGAQRMNARYLLDGGLPGPALRAYLRCWFTRPQTAAPETRRMLYAAASLLFNVEGLKTRYLQRRKRKLG